MDQLSGKSAYRREVQMPKRVMRDLRDMVHVGRHKRRKPRGVFPSVFVQTYYRIPPRRRRRSAAENDGCPKAMLMLALAATLMYFAAKAS